MKNKISLWVGLLLGLLLLMAVVMPVLGQEETPEANPFLGNVGEETPPPAPPRTQGGEQEIATQAVVILPADEATLQDQINTELTDSLTGLADDVADQATFNIVAIIGGFVAFGLAALMAVYKSVPPEVGKGILAFAENKLNAVSQTDLIPGTKIDDALIAYIRSEFDDMKRQLEIPSEVLSRRTAVEKTFRADDSPGVG